MPIFSFTQSLRQTSLFTYSYDFGEKRQQHPRHEVSNCQRRLPCEPTVKANKLFLVDDILRQVYKDYGHGTRNRKIQNQAMGQYPLKIIHVVAHKIIEISDYPGSFESSTREMRIAIPRDCPHLKHFNKREAEAAQPIWGLMLDDFRQCTK